MYKKMLVLFTIPFFLCSKLVAQSDQVDSSGMLTIRVDPQNTRGASVSDIFEEVKFIPMETTKQSLFGSVEQLALTENYFVILDSDRKSVLIFDRTGKYVSKIEKSRIEKDKNDSKVDKNYNIRIVTDHGVKTISIYNANYDLHYDFNGKFLKKHVAAQLESAKVKSINNSEYRYQRHWIDQDGKDYDLVFFKNNQVFSKYLPAKKGEWRYNSNGERGTNQEDMAKNYFLNVPFTYNIYKANPPKLDLAYRFVFPAKMSLPEDFTSNPIYADRDKFLNNNRGIAYGLFNIHLYGDHLFFKLDITPDPNKKESSLIYNVKTAEVISLDKIEPDEMSFHLPIDDIEEGYRCLYGFAAADDNYLYNSYSAYSLFEFKDENEGEEFKYNDVLNTFFKTQNKKSNPLIIQLKPKKE